jgi:hypothetical protein
MAERVTLVVELDRNEDPISGSVSGDDGRKRGYVGWLALIAALDELRQSPGERGELCDDGSR